MSQVNSKSKGIKECQQGQAFSPWKYITNILSEQCHYLENLDNVKATSRIFAKLLSSLSLCNKATTQAHT